ncbi:MAG: cobyric acid synthase [bacterium]
MSAKTIMIQGTGSYVGKSVVTAALCRIFTADGYKVAPFKAQNMALNSFVTKNGEEMGRAQVVQAEACGIEPSVDMNPVLLKPSSDVGCQVIVMGKPVGNMDSVTYHKHKPKLMDIVVAAFNRLAEKNDIIVIEGAGSPAEINLRDNDIVNMSIAEKIDAPVIIVGDINLGGVFAWLVGTIELLSNKEKKRVKGFLINKFRGDRSLLEPAITFLEKRTQKPVLGVIPYFTDIKIQEEDSVCIDPYKSSSPVRDKDDIRIRVIYLPHISNFTDFDMLEKEHGVELEYIKRADELKHADVIIIPGSKNTIDDLAVLRKSGFIPKIKECSSKGVSIIGTCGGYQMLGKEIIDPDHIETKKTNIKGIGLLDITTTIKKEKQTHQIKAYDNLFSSGVIHGYEIHMGQTRLGNTTKPIFEIFKRSGKRVNIKDGTKSREGRVWGTYIHGIFDNNNFRAAFLNNIRKSKQLPERGLNNLFDKEQEYDKLALLVRKSVDIKKIYFIIKEAGK